MSGNGKTWKLLSLGHTPLLRAVNPYLVVLQTLFSIEYELEASVCQIHCGFALYYSSYWVAKAEFLLRISNTAARAANAVRKILLWMWVITDVIMLTYRKPINKTLYIC